MTAVTWSLPEGTAPRRLDVLAMGSFLAEQVIHVERHPAAGGQGSIPIRSLASSTGGGAANVAAYAARLGGRSAILATTGDGPRSRAALARLDDAGVDTGCRGRPSRAATRISSCCSATPPVTGLRWSSWTRRSASRDADLGPAVPFAEATWFHVDGYAHHSAGGQAVVDEAVRLARAAGCLISVDAAVPSSLADPAYLRSLFGRADIAFANRAEATALTGETQDAAAVDALLALGPAVVVLKCGADGSLVATPDGQARVAAIPVDVVDTLAAGDAYVAAMLVGLARGEAGARGRRDGVPRPARSRAGRRARRAARSPRPRSTPSSPAGPLPPGPRPALAGARASLFADLDGPLPAFVLVPGSEHRVHRFGERLDGHAHARARAGLPARCRNPRRDPGRGLLHRASGGMA